MKPALKTRSGGASGSRKPKVLKSPPSFVIALSVEGPHNELVIKNCSQVPGVVILESSWLKTFRGFGGIELTSVFALPSWKISESSLSRVLGTIPAATAGGSSLASSTPSPSTSAEKSLTALVAASKDAQLLESRPGAKLSATAPVARFIPKKPKWYVRFLRWLHLAKAPPVSLADSIARGGPRHGVVRVGLPAQYWGSWGTGGTPEKSCGAPTNAAAPPPTQQEWDASEEARR